jgi:hypothetical protein
MLRGHSEDLGERRADHTGRSQSSGGCRSPGATHAKDGLIDRSPGPAGLPARADCRSHNDGTPGVLRADRRPPWQTNGGPIASRMQPPNRPRCHSVCSGCAMQHRQYRCDADAGSDEDNGRLTRREHERTARSADLQATARPDTLVEKTTCEAALVLDGDPIGRGLRGTAQRIVSHGGSIRARPHADHDVLARECRWEPRTVFGGQLE